jgi:hypothetical protein
LIKPVDLKGQKSTGLSDIIFHATSQISMLIWSFPILNSLDLTDKNPRMEWETACTNEAVVNAFNDYRSLLDRIATLYAGSRLIESIDLSALGADTGLAISDDFSEGFTTVRTIDDLQNSIETGEY